MPKKTHPIKSLYARKEYKSARRRHDTDKKYARIKLSSNMRHYRGLWLTYIPPPIRSFGGGAGGTASWPNTSSRVVVTVWSSTGGGTRDAFLLMLPMSSTSPISPSCSSSSPKNKCAGGPSSSERRTAPSWRVHVFSLKKKTNTATGRGDATKRENNAGTH